MLHLTIICKDVTMQKGFTLSEILITLAIIGVVAVMTIPAVMTKYTKRVVETRLAHFYSAINQAMVRAEVDLGDVKSWDTLANPNVDGISNIETTEKNKEWVNKYLCPYFKCVSVETCPHHAAKVCVSMVNGSAFSIMRDDFTFYPDRKNLNKDNNFQGKTCFAFTFAPTSVNSKYSNNKRVEPYVGSWNGKKSTLFTSNTYGCKCETNCGCGNNQNKYCTKLIQMNGWEIPRDYPFKF